MKSIFLALMLTLCTGFSVFAQSSVGIGTSSPNPNYKVDVIGKIHSTGDMYTDGYVGIGTTAPLYKLQVNDGSIAVFNSADTKTWYFNYSSSGNYFQLSEGGIARMVVANGGNVGINTTAPAYKLDVNGTANVETNLTVGGTTAIDGNLTVNSGKGIVRSWNNSQIRYYTQQSTVHAVIPAHDNSIEGTIAWPSGIFTAPPKVLVGDIVTTGGTIGTLFRVFLVPYDVTTNSCHFRLVNTDNTNVDYNITWNIVYMGQ